MRALSINRAFQAIFCDLLLEPQKLRNVLKTEAVLCFFNENQYFR